MKDLCIKDCIPLSATTTLFMIYSLDLDNNILHLMPELILLRIYEKLLMIEIQVIEFLWTYKKLLTLVDHQILLAKLNQHGVLGV